MIGITNREFPGVIINDPKSPKEPKFDIKNRGRYLVHIPELMYSLYDTEDNGIFCVNHVTKWRDTYLKDKDGKHTIPSCGSYYPLQTGMHVIVKFFSEDFESGYIDRIISDYYGKDSGENSMPLDCDPIERDNFYQVLRTTKDDFIYVSTLKEKGKTLPKHSFHIYYKGDYVRIICDEDTGLSIYSRKNIKTRSEEETSMTSDKKMGFESNEEMTLVSIKKMGIRSEDELSIASKKSMGLQSNIDIILAALKKISLTADDELFLISKKNLNLHAEKIASIMAKEVITITCPTVLINGSLMLGSLVGTPPEKSEPLKVPNPKFPSNPLTEPVYIPYYETCPCYEKCNGGG